MANCIAGTLENGAPGHTIPRKHQAECPRTDCAGCLPAHTQGRDLICEWHQERVREALNYAPKLIAHIRDHVQPGASNSVRPAEKGKGFSPPAPLNISAVSDADDLHAELASWALLIMEEHPSRLHGPGWNGADVRPASTRRSNGERIYDPARVVGLAASADPLLTTHAICRWIARQLPWAITQEWAGALTEELTDRVSRMRARWPMDERRVFLPVPCQACARLTLTRSAPAEPGDPVTIACVAVDCNEVIPPEKYDFMIKVFAEAEAEKKKKKEREERRAAKALKLTGAQQ